MRFKNAIWMSKSKFKDFFISSETKQKSKYLKSSLWAIILGFIVAGVVLVGFGNNPFYFFGNMFEKAFQTNYREITVAWIAIFMVTGLGVAVGFKSGVFNIGVSGQMLLGSGMSIIFYNKFFASSTNTAGAVVTIFIVCVVSGALLAGLAGLLKALFNIHEVVSTIMLNWTVFYVLKYLFMNHASLTGGTDSTGNTAIRLPADMLAINGNNMVVPIIMAIVLVLIVAVVLAKTTFGYKLKAVGSSPTAAKYAGINVKAKIVQAMLLSGGIAGVAAFFQIFTVSRNINFGVDVLPTIGFDAIAVSLVAFSNPLGLIPVGFLWGIIQTGGMASAGIMQMPKEIPGLIFGIIVYFAAISNLLMKFGSVAMIKTKIYIFTSKNKRNNLHEINIKKNKYRLWILNPKSNPDYKKDTEEIMGQINLLTLEIKDNKNKLEIVNIKKQELAILQNNLKSVKADYKVKWTSKLNVLNQNSQKIKQSLNQEKMLMGIRGIKTRRNTTIDTLREKALEEISSIRFNDEIIKDNIRTQRNNILFYSSRKKEIVKKVYKDKVLAANVAFEGAMGDLTLKYELFNGKIRIKSDMDKSVYEIKELIHQVKSNLRIKSALLTSDNISEKQALKTLAEQEISILKQKISETKVNAKLELATLQNNFNFRKEELIRDPRKVNELKDIHNQAIAKAKKDYKIDLEKIEFEISEGKRFINKDKTKNEVLSLKDLYRELKSNVEEILSSKDSFDEKIFELVVDAYERAIVQKDYILGEEIFSPLDEKRYLIKKTNLLIKIETFLSKYQIANIITKIESVMDEVQIENENLLNEVVVYYKNLKQENKTKVSGIDINQEKTVIKNRKMELETEFNDNLEQFIISNEQKYLKITEGRS
ncbi:ABC transporter permease subunit [[Acholeplasma] multilocale]|uniref:ABC transporter permease subunit n=1 Tax=[Acholeplasma] multilocale TaxID=264638 RepID=UPI00047B789D|nr:ABC transporter permease [[Acholeplasma] multilocale]